MIAETTKPMSLDEFVEQVSKDYGAYPCFVEEKFNGKTAIYPALFDCYADYKNKEACTSFHDLASSRDMPGVTYGITWRVWGMKVPSPNIRAKTNWDCN